MVSVAQQARVRQLRACRTFSGLDEDVLADLAASAITRHLSVGEHLWRAGDPARQFTLVHSGLIKIVRHAPDGSDAIVALFGPRETVGDAAVIARGTYPADAVVASETATIVRADATPVLSAMDSRPSVAGAMNRALLDHTRALQEKIAVMSAGPVDRRLATLLLLLAERFGDEREDGTLVVPVPLSRQELSRLVGATVETVIRSFSRWKKAGVVEDERLGFVIVRPEDLRAVTRGER